jgi:DNA-binding beta-propeller fold protein YncE
VVLPSPVLPGSTLAGYRIESEVGHGGMGVVLRARQLSLDRVVALKLIAPAVAADESFRARFRRESRLLASVNHQHVVTVYEAGEADGHLFVSMRWIDGTDLGRLIAEEGPFLPFVAAGIVDQVAGALDAAHDVGVVHRDVKPANILIEDGADAPIAYLGDFGLSTKVGSEATRLTASGGLVGTLDYIAPEQIEDRTIDRRTDVYALGCVLYEAVTGSVPFVRGSDPARLWAHLHDPPPSAREKSPGVTGELDAVIRRALAKDPERRWPSAGELGHAALAAAGDGGAATVADGGTATVADGGTATVADGGTATITGTVARRRRPSTAWPGIRPLHRRRAALLAAGAVVLAGAAVAAVLLVSGGRSSSHARLGSRAAAAAPTGPLPARPVTVQRFALGRNVAPGDVGASIDAAYVIDRRTDRVLVIDPDSGLVVRRLPGGTRPGMIDTDQASDHNRAWIVGSGGTLEELDTARGRLIEAPIRVQRDAAYATDTGDEVAVLSRRDSGATMLRVDPSRRRTIGREERIGSAITDLGSFDGDLWVLSAFPPTLSRFSGRLVPLGDATLSLGPNLSDIPDAMAIDGTTAWIACTCGKVIRFDLAAGHSIGAPIPVGRQPVDIAVGDGSVWVPSPRDDTLTRIDEKTARVIGAPIPVKNIIGSVAVDAAAGEVWLGGARDLVRVKE